MRNKSALLALLAFLAGIGVASTAGLLFRWIEDSNLREHEIVREFPSPNGDRVAMVILSGCGATTPFATSVAVKRVGESFDFDSYDANLFIVRDKNNIEVEWDERKLALRLFMTDQTV